MPVEECVKRGMPSLRIEFAVKIDGEGDVVGVAVRIELSEEPESLLGERKRERQIAGKRIDGGQVEARGVKLLRDDVGECKERR